MNLEANQLAKRYAGQYALVDFSYTFEPGKLYFILGHNGSGKSTLLNILSAVERSSQGTLAYNGIPVSFRDPEYRKNLGYLAHYLYLYPHLTGFENALFFAGLYGVENREKECLRLLKEFRLFEAKDKTINQYSRGMLQKLAFLRSTIHRPKILLLDEPFTGLDFEARKIFLEKISEMIQRNTMVIATTHDLEALSAFESTVIILKDGMLQFSEQGIFSAKRLTEILSQENSSRV